MAIDVDIEAELIALLEIVNIGNPPAIVNANTSGVELNINDTYLTLDEIRELQESMEDRVDQLDIQLYTRKYKGQSLDLISKKSMLLKNLENTDMHENPELMNSIRIAIDAHGQGVRL
jgi:hypothetical protein